MQIMGNTFAPSQSRTTVLLFNVREQLAPQAAEPKEASPDTVTETRLEVKMPKTVGVVIIFLVIVWIPVLIVEIFYARGSQSCIIMKLDVVSVL